MRFEFARYGCLANWLMIGSQMSLAVTLNRCENVTDYQPRNTVSFGRIGVSGSRWRFLPVGMLSELAVGVDGYCEGSPV